MMLSLAYGRDLFSLRERTQGSAALHPELCCPALSVLQPLASLWDAS
jgi:hypothetical protein